MITCLWWYFWNIADVSSKRHLTSSVLAIDYLSGFLTKICLKLHLLLLQSPIGFLCISNFLKTTMIDRCLHYSKISSHSTNNSVTEIAYKCIYFVFWMKLTAVKLNHSKSIYWTTKSNHCSLYKTRIHKYIFTQNDLNGQCQLKSWRKFLIFKLIIQITQLTNDIIIKYMR